jgi:hypothetical protein
MVAAQLPFVAAAHQDGFDAVITRVDEPGVIDPGLHNPVVLHLLAAKDKVAQAAFHVASPGLLAAE